MASGNISLKQMKKRILSLKSGMVKNITTITAAMSRMMSGVNTVLNTLLDENALRDSDLGINSISYSGIAEGLKKSSESTGEKMRAELLKSFKTVPKDFAVYGEDATEWFKNGFMACLPDMMKEIKAAVDAEIASVCAREKAYMSESLGGGSTYNASYNFYGSAQSVTQQLEQARQSELVNRLRK